MPAHKVTHEAASGGGSSGRALHAHAHTPSTRCGRFILTTKEDAVAAPDSPVFVIFGWVNARDVHVAQYAQLYHALGAAYVLRTTAPTSDVFLKPAGLRDLARHTLDTLQTKFRGRPAIVSYFSNGGCFVHTHILAEMRARRQQAQRADGSMEGVNIVGFMFDSCPAWMSLRSGSMGLTGFIRNAAARNIAFYITIVLFALVMTLTCNWAAPTRFFRAMEEDESGAPALYIYSDADAITEADKLAALIQRRRAAGHAVVEWRIDDPRSAHVAHYRQDREQYKRRVREFMDTALTLSKQ